jgi:hypothetical protein
MWESSWQHPSEHTSHLHVCFCDASCQCLAEPVTKSVLAAIQDCNRCGGGGHCCGPGAVVAHQLWQVELDNGAVAIGDDGVREVLRSAWVHMEETDSVTSTAWQPGGRSQQATDAGGVLR